jgi:hypothetical protein
VSSDAAEGTVDASDERSLGLRRRVVVSAVFQMFTHLLILTSRGELAYYSKRSTVGGRHE